MKISGLHWKSGFSNLLVNRTYAIVALKIFVLAFVSNELLPKRRVFMKIVSDGSRRLLSIFSVVLSRVRLSVIYLRQWKRKCAVNLISKPQLQSGFKESWKLRLNLCSCKWIRPSHNFFNKFDFFGIMAVKKTISRWPDLINIGFFC